MNIFSFMKKTTQNAIRSLLARNFGLRPFCPDCKNPEVAEGRFYDLS